MALEVLVKLTKKLEPAKLYLFYQKEEKLSKMHLLGILLGL